MGFYAQNAGDSKTTSSEEQSQPNATKGEASLYFVRGPLTFPSDFSSVDSDFHYSSFIIISIY